MSITVFTTPKLTVFADEFNRATIGSDYTVNGGTFACNPRLVLSGGTDVFTNYISRNYTTGFENWTNVIDFKINALGYGFGFTIKSPVLDFTIKLCCGVTDLGKIKVYGYGTNLHSTSINAAPLTIDRKYRFKIIKRKDLFIFIIEDHYFNEIWRYTWISNISISSAVASLPKTGNPSITNFGGDIEISKWEFIANEFYNPILAIIGDSITQCYFANTMIKRWADIQQQPFRRSILGCGGDTAAIAYTRLADINLLMPKNVLIFLGANETSTTTFNTNLTNIITYLLALSPTPRIIFTSCIPKTSSDRAAYNTVIRNLCTAYSLQYINIYTPLKGTGFSLATAYDSGDGIHPNNAGHALIGLTVKNNISLKL